MRSLSPLDRYRFDARGYVLFENVLSPQEVDALEAAVAGRRLPPAGPTVESQRFGWHGELLAWHQGFRDLLDHPLSLAVLDSFIGSYARLDHAYGIVMAAGTSGLGLHGPAWPFDPAQYYVHRGGAVRSGLLSFSWALTDGVPGAGGFGCIPGSHRAEEPLPAGAESLVEEVPQPAGSLLVFTEALVHCTLPWRGHGDRRVLLYKYSPGSSTWAPYEPVPPSAARAMSDRQRRLTERPFVGGRRPWRE
ncbi:MAG TPA: phytanoyl-CoA dioxygenase family protein [Acidimicrobiales bacterium]|nr:phytanoyl-CoA dioxygenase family protein [Acidimicrobiales bacterium]